MTGQLRDLKGDLASCYGGLRDGDDGPHLLELCFNNPPPRSANDSRNFCHFLSHSCPKTSCAHGSRRPQPRRRLYPVRISSSTRVTACDIDIPEWRATRHGSVVPSCGGMEPWCECKVYKLHKALAPNRESHVLNDSPREIGTARRAPSIDFLLWHQRFFWLWIRTTKNRALGLTHTASSRHKSLRKAW